MKISRSISTLFALALGISAATAAVPAVTVDLAGTEFGDGLEVHVTSGVERLLPATSYQYRIEGTIHGTGLLAFLFPNGTDIATLIDDIEDNGSDFLEGTQPNPAGTLPFTVINKAYNGTIPITVPGVGSVNATASVTIKGKVSGSGQVRFDVTNVSLTVPGFTITDKIVFEAGSRLIVNVSPVVQFKFPNHTVTENNGVLNVKVKRSKNAAGPVSVTLSVQNGTADGSDFTLVGGPINFADGEVTKTISIPIIDNDDADGNRSFKLKLSLPTGGAVFGPNKKTNVTITDND